MQLTASPWKQFSDSLFGVRPRFTSQDKFQKVNQPFTNFSEILFPFEETFIFASSKQEKVKPSPSIKQTVKNILTLPC